MRRKIHKTYNIRKTSKALEAHKPYKIIGIYIAH